MPSVRVLAAHTSTGVPVAALLPIIVLGAVFVGYCWVDIARAGSVRYLPKWLWALISFVSVPLGGIVYLLVGREH